MRIDIITIFPDYLAPLDLSLVGKARRAGTLDLRVHDLRAHAHDRHRTVDDAPYGGGPGMVMRAEPWGEALDAVLASGPGPDAEPDAEPDSEPAAGLDSGLDSGLGSGLDSGHGPDCGPEAGMPGRGQATVCVPTPSGRRLDQALAQELAARDWLVIACGRYEGIDHRVVEHFAARGPLLEISLGDYVLAGGEAAALVLVEAVTRLVPGVLGNEASVRDDSFAPGDMAGLLEGPVYTRPPVWRGLAVPDVLVSGDHARIAAWRAEQARQRTAQRRPDLGGAREFRPGEPGMPD